MPDGCGPVSGLYRVEAALNALEDVNIKPSSCLFLSQLNCTNRHDKTGGYYGRKFW